MTLDFAAVFLGLVLLAAGIAAGLLLAGRRREERPPAPDPGLQLLQQQIGHLAEQVAQLGARVPREVGDSLQRASAETGRVFADIKRHLGELGRSTEVLMSIGQEVRDLQQIFQAPKVRGGLGELALESLLRQLFPAEHFATQHHFSDGLTVDAVLRLPGGLVPIDSKFPLAGFRTLLEASGDDDRQRARRAFGRDVRKHIDDIAGKYIRPAEGTLDFALMYIPAENVYYEIILQGDGGAGAEDLGAYARGRRVIPVSPNTLFAYLKAIAYGLMGLKIEERAREILKGLQQLHGDMEGFHGAFALGQKHLRNAQSAFDDAGERARTIASRVDQFARAADEEPSRGSVVAALRGRPR
ncbi:MAG: DNA recombination protein RmuC [Acidobacteriota bacterium]